MDTKAETSRIVLVGRQQIFVESLAAAIDDCEQISVVGTYREFGSLDRHMVDLKPNLVVFDALASESEFISLGNFVATHSDTGVVVLGSSGPQPGGPSFFELGVAGFVSKDSSIDELTEAIERVLRGERFCSPRVAQDLFSTLADLAEKRRRIDRIQGCNLTSRELEILGLVAEGLRNSEIAERLHLSPHTVKNHVHRILDKLQVHHRSAAVAEAFKRRWITFGGSRVAS